MITNNNLIEHLTESFKVFTETGSRSDKKLLPLHGGIAKDVMEKLRLFGYDEITISVDVKGYGSNKEAKVKGRYIDKDIDITFNYKGEPILCINVKSIQQNYRQNSNNYYENMLGETVNIQFKNGIPLFQVFIIPQQIPYFKSDKTFKSWEYFNKYSASKYIDLSQDEGYHVPCGTLVFNYKLNDMPNNPVNSDEYKAYYHDNINISMYDDLKNVGWGKNTYFNDYKGFVDCVVNTITFKIGAEEYGVK